ncbi:MAG TPA: C-terminal helicase domain-containing protein, partial [Agromyces sp.]|nr:C-terminal helicase domain-containing protein [Agromyces sp.]
EQGIPAVDLHGNLSQPQRDRNLAAFGDGSVKVLVATDVAARGVHVDDVEFVIHVDPPMEHKSYLHRSGRTARAGSEGDVITICLPAQKQDLKTLLRKAAITVTPQRVTASSPAVTTLVGEIAAYVKPVPKAAQPQGGGRSQGANAQRKRSVRDDRPGSGEGRSGQGRGRGRGQSDVAPSTPRRDRSGRPAETKAHAPKQGAGHSRGAQSTGAQRGGAKQPMRVGSLVSSSTSRNARGNRRAQG